MEPFHRPKFKVLDFELQSTALGLRPLPWHLQSPSEREVRFLKRSNLLCPRGT